MKKAGLILLCLALLLAVVGAGTAWLLLTPRGMLRTDRPEELMEQLLESSDRSDWRNEYIRLCAPQVTEFEDASRVAGMIFDAAVPGEDFSFRAVPGSESDNAQEFILSAPGADLLRVCFTYAGGHWSHTFSGLDSLRAEPRTLSITVPEDTAVTLNGKSVGENYIAARDLPYPDMTALELGFPECPTQVRYEIGGIYGDAAVDAQREGGLIALYADGSDWRYTLPDAASHAFSVKAPAQAVVTVNGVTLSDEYVVATSSYPTRLTIPDALLSTLPSYKIYAAGGLYTAPEITAVLPDGTALEPERAEDGTVSFTQPPSQELYNACHERVDSFLRALSEYGAGHMGYGPGAYAVVGSEAGLYITRARSSLTWTVGVAVTVNEISSSEYVPLGEDAFLCRGHVDCTTRTRYQTRDLNVNYLMLWIRNGTTWLIEDLSYA